VGVAVFAWWGGFFGGEGQLLDDAVGSGDGARGALGLQKGVGQVQPLDDLRDTVGIGAQGQPARGQRRGIILIWRKPIGRGVHPDMMRPDGREGILGLFAHQCRPHRKGP